MSNIVSTKGLPKSAFDVHIRDMEPGDVGYAVEWAVQDGVLNENFTVGEKGGTASMRVTCVAKGQYEIEYETPKYRPIRLG